LTGSAVKSDSARMSDRRDIAGPADTPDTVLATYREIAARFALGSNTAARVKAKRQIARGRWSAAPANHPADPIRIKIPREDWEQGADLAEMTPRAARRAASDTPGIKASRSARTDAALAELRAQLERERARAEAAEALVAELRRELEEQRGLTVSAEQRADRVRGQLGAAEAALDEVRAGMAALTADISWALARYRLQSFVPSLLRELGSQVLHAMFSAAYRRNDGRFGRRYRQQGPP
jgi:hypothetical protein